MFFPADESWTNQLWIGAASDGRCLSVLHDSGVQIVIDLAYEELPAQLSRDMVYHRIPLVDSEGNHPRLLQMAVTMLLTALNCGLGTLVCCSAGLSRSPVITAMALSRFRSESPLDCLENLRTVRRQRVNPILWKDTLRAVDESGI